MLDALMTLSLSGGMLPIMVTHSPRNMMVSAESMRVVLCGTSCINCRFLEHSCTGAFRVRSCTNPRRLVIARYARNLPRLRMTQEDSSGTCVVHHATTPTTRNMHRIFF